ncbi:MAG: two-component regulator propeller domain-containing protein [Bacteroidota bacterium]
MYEKLILTFLGVTLLAVLPAQVSHEYFERLTSGNGLSENHVNCIHQDASGFMWFGTFDGLNRFDGYEVVTYKPNPNDTNSISGILIYAMAEDQEGNLWIGTTGSGLNRFSPDTETFICMEADAGQTGSLLDNEIRSLVVDRQNRLWVGSEKGVSMLDLNEWDPTTPAVFRKKVFSVDQRIMCLYEARDGGLWAGTNAGLFRIAANPSGEIESTRLPVSTNRPYPSLNTITELPQGGLVLGGEGIFYQLPGSEPMSFAPIAQRTVINLAVDSSAQHLWVGTRQGLEVFRVSRNGAELRRVTRFLNKPQDPSSLSNNTIDELYVDRSGLIWVGTFGGGVNRYDPHRKPFQRLNQTDVPAGLASNSIRAVYQTRDERVWVGTVGGGLLVSEGSIRPGQPVAFRELAGPSRTYSLLEVKNDRRHSLFVGTDVGPGLYEIDLRDPKLTARQVPEVSPAAFATLEDSRSNLWFGTYSGGLFRWRADPAAPQGYHKEQFRAGDGPDQLPSDIIRSLMEDRRGNLWIGTAEGLVFLPNDEKDRKEPRFTVFRNQPGDETSLSHDYILPLHEARDGTIWIGTLGGGLNRYLPPNEGQPARFERILEEDGLPNNVIKSILEDDDGNLWVASNKGILRYDPVTKSLLAFDDGDGLQSNEFQELAAWRQRNGLMIFGGVNGLDLFYPQDIEINEAVGQPVLTGLEINNLPVEPGKMVNDRVLLDKRLASTKSLHLRHQENSLTITFAALNYATPEKNRFAYKLDGFDEDWVYTDATQRRATYTNLPYDDFTFLVKSANNDGIWNEEPVRLGVFIEPPFYLKWYAYVFYGLLTLALLYAFRRYSLIDIKEKNRLTIERVSRAKDRELSQLKLQFFTNISHEFRTPLTLITGPLETMMRSAGNLTSLERDNYHHLMYKNAKYLLRLVNQLLDFRRLDQGQMPLQVGKRDVVGFLREVTAPFAFLASKKGIDFQLEIDEEPIAIWFDPDVLEKVIYNLLANAFKFAPENGQVVLAIYKQAGGKTFNKAHFKEYGAVVLNVRDNGPGIPRKQLKRIFDRFYKNASGEATNREGAGIGLAYTKSLIDLHHGTIDVQSKVGEGTSFYVRLPLDKTLYAKEEISTAGNSAFVPAQDPVDYLLPETHAPIVDATLTEQAPAPGVAYLKQEEEESPLLLYIDDNADLRNFIRSSLAADFRVIAADGGAAGLELARTSIPDIIVSDVMMPEVDGMEVLRSLKEDPQTSHIPIIMLTAKSTLEDKTEGLGYGADGYVTKPFNIDLLRQQIINTVRQRETLRDRFRREVITSPKEVTVTNADEEFLKRAMDIVEENMSNTDFSVEQLVKEMRVSRSKLYLKLKALTGQSSSEFVRTVRLKRAVQLLENSGYSVKEVMYMTGFNTASYFSKCFRQQFGIVPSEYVKQRKKAAETGAV